MMLRPYLENFILRRYAASVMMPGDPGREAGRED